MACEIMQAGADGVRIRISGLMSIADLRMIQETCLALIKQGASLRLLVMLENFQGWEQTSAWEQTAFMPEQDRQMQKMAIIGDEQWRDQACAFVAKGLRPFAIEYFEPSAQAAAERWLQA